MRMSKSHFRAVKRGAEKVVSICEGWTYPARGRQFPAMLINALPKSGSTFIAKTLRQTLECRRADIATKFGANMRVLSVVAVRGNTVCHQHFPGEPHIIAALGATIGRMVLNLRDPRAALVSWTHSVNGLNREHSYLRALQMARVIPPGYFEMSIQDQVAWQVDNRLPFSVEWIRRWLEAVDQPTPELAILLTDYRDMIADTRAFMERILEFYGIAIEPEWLTVRKPQPGQWKFRAGTTKDWRADYSPAALDRATSMMPESWGARFGWQ